MLNRRWFVVTKDVRRELVGGSMEVMPASVAHAKEMGTTRTACGLNASSWHKLWEQSFNPSAPGACGECAALCVRS